MKSYLKKLLLPSGRAPRVIRGGLLAGLRVDMDFAHHTQLWLGLQERELNVWFHRLSRGICTAIDVGANEGLYTLYFLARTPAQKVLAFEPEAENLSHIERNLALNQLASDPRFELVNKFVGGAVEGEFTSLDAFSDAIASPCLVKVDIDGGEVALLHGARNLLRRANMRWIIEVHSVDLERECLAILQEASYTTAIIPNAWWRTIFPEMRQIEHNRWLVATHDES
jgi:hypothetical protein